MQVLRLVLLLYMCSHVLCGWRSLFKLPHRGCPKSPEQEGGGKNATLAAAPALATRCEQNQEHVNVLIESLATMTQRLEKTCEELKTAKMQQAKEDPYEEMEIIIFKDDAPKKTYAPREDLREDAYNDDDDDEDDDDDDYSCRNVPWFIKPHSRPRPRHAKRPLCKKRSKPCKCQMRRFARVVTDTVDPLFRTCACENERRPTDGQKEQDMFVVKDNKLTKCNPVNAKVIGVVRDSCTDNSNKIICMPKKKKN